MATITNIAPKLQRLFLLLSSDQPGEVVAAAAALKRTLQSSGCDFHDLVAGLTSSSAEKIKFPEEPEDRDEYSWHAWRDFCLAHQGSLRSREHEFVTSLKTWRGPLSEKQFRWLEAIHMRLQRRAA